MANESFINTFKKESRISLRRYNKLITRETSKRKMCTLNGMHQPYSNFLYLSKYNIFQTPEMGLKAKDHWFQHILHMKF